MSLKESPAPLSESVAEASGDELVTATKRNFSPDKAPAGNCKRSPQAPCAMRGKPSDKPSRFYIPLDLLGHSRRWPGAPKIDRETLEKISLA